MTTPAIIPFARRERLVKKARPYLDDPERFLSDVGEALPVLIRALPVADEDVKNAIIILLGGGCGKTVVFPLYRIMIDTAETEETRFHAAIHLSQILSGMTDTEAIGHRLEQDLRHPDPIFRRNAAVAYGWEGNSRAADFLMDLIRQGDPEIRAEAATALTNLNIDSVFPLIKTCYETGNLDQQRVILYNLWRLTHRRDDVLDLVKRALAHPDDGLRLDAMIVFCALPDTDRHHEVYLAGLKDPVAAIRELSLRQLENAAQKLRQSVRGQIAALSDDPHPAVRVMARRFLMAADPHSRAENTDGLEHNT